MRSFIICIVIKLENTANAEFHDAYHSKTGK
jgi:hypothetical protein